jgi:steroid 5-alpha reductase family enzyme
MTDFSAALLGLSAVLTGATALWVWSVRHRDASVADVWWGPGFVLLAWLYCVWPGLFGIRPLAIALLLTIWGLRLGAHLLSRRRGAKEDPRYRAMRERRGASFWWRSLFIVFWLQAAILWFVALPVWAAARVPGPDAFTVLDAIGGLLFAAGFLFETIGDAQLARFRARPENRGRVLDTGLWRYTRHPNYFGDALVWWGVYLIAASMPGAWMTIGSPVLMTVLLMRVSGVTLLEHSLRTTKPGYADYMARTSAFVPWFPRH